MCTVLITVRTVFFFQGPIIPIQFNILDRHVRSRYKRNTRAVKNSASTSYTYRNSSRKIESRHTYVLLTLMVANTTYLQKRFQNLKKTMGTRRNNIENIVSVQIYLYLLIEILFLNFGDDVQRERVLVVSSGCDSTFIH